MPPATAAPAGADRRTSESPAVGHQLEVCDTVSVADVRLCELRLTSGVWHVSRATRRSFVVGWMNWASYVQFETQRLYGCRICLGSTPISPSLLAASKVP
jgi:hypothetical protein